MATPGRAQPGSAFIWSLPPQVTAHWEKFKETLGPGKETKKVQADFVKSAVRDVRYGPQSLSAFTQWRVRPPFSELAPGPVSLLARMACGCPIQGCGHWGGTGKTALLVGVWLWELLGDLPLQHQVRIISEELVAAWGAQGDSVPEKPPQAAAAGKAKVHVSSTREVSRTPALPAVERYGKGVSSVPLQP